MVKSNNSVKEWTGVHSSLVVSLHKINNILGKQITVGQLIEYSKHTNVLRITMRFTWALQHNT
jgi:hypothetical protein